MYHFLEHSPEVLQEIIDQLKQRRSVEVIINPANNRVYGSDLDSYRAKFNLIDFLATRMDEAQALSFERIVPIALVAKVDDWQWRLRERGPAQIDSYRGRLEEAKSSLEWVLAHAHQVHVLPNPMNLVAKTASKIIDICRQGPAPAPGEAALEQAQSMLDFVHSELAKL
jgi:hypothetical protein